VTGPTLQAAVDELYSSPTAEFTARRKALAESARKAGDRETATRIGALRKPTRSADTLNRLVRSAGDEVSELLDLGAQLRAAEKALDGPKMRELSTQRRQLVGDLTKLAFDITDQPSPSASVREEVSATLNAALADDEVADRLVSGALVTHAQWDGFGSTSLPELAAVLPMNSFRRSKPVRDETGPFTQDLGSADDAPVTGSDERPANGAPPAKSPGRTDKRTRESAGRVESQQARRRRDQTERAAAQAAAAKAAAERERQRRLESAKLEATDAEQAATAAQHELQAIDRRISELSLQLAHQRQLLADAQRAVRSTEARRRAAHLALTRAGGSPG
jgi:hypothetical protein